MRPTLAILLIVAGCAPSVDAPSLLPRPFETQTEPVVQRPTGCEDTRQAATIAELGETSTKASADFDREFAIARTIAPERSEAWVNAQNARSAAELARGQVLDVLSKFDEVLQLQANSTCDVGPYLAARTRTQRVADAEQERLDSLSPR